MDYHEFSIYYGILFYNFPIFLFGKKLPINT